MSANVDLRELRQNASELVRRAQAGEVITITVSGRPSARLVPAGSTHWRRWDDFAELFRGLDDPDRHHDRELVTDDPRGPWDRQ
ncbi:MAG: type II toxin-antitoxin system prevent-host-death family antitoxin [Actinobacteria bacterium]|nr:type II toxin-antitoxin system prevent-host-death family antitoxin [Actinomycetota bacterium]